MPLSEMVAQQKMVKARFPKYALLAVKVGSFSSEPPPRYGREDFPCIRSAAERE
jgi:hypothetical protein